MRMIIAKWQSRGGAFVVELYHETEPAPGYGYTARNAGGWLGNITEAEALAQMERRVNDFQPDINRTPMRRTE